MVENVSGGVYPACPTRKVRVHGGGAVLRSYAYGRVLGCTHCVTLILDTHEAWAVCTLGVCGCVVVEVALRQLALVAGAGSGVSGRLGMS